MHLLWAMIYSLLVHRYSRYFWIVSGDISMISSHLNNSNSCLLGVSSPDYNYNIQLLLILRLMILIDNFVSFFYLWYALQREEANSVDQCNESSSFGWELWMERNWITFQDSFVDHSILWGRVNVFLFVLKWIFLYKDFCNIPPFLNCAY